MILDVAVVGAGPAGSTLAATLARGGASVALIDASHPREKPCGGGFTGRALSLVANLLPEPALSGVDIRTVRFLDTPGGKHALVDLDARHRLVVASRTVADSALYEAALAAGATPVRARVTNVQLETPACVSLNDGRTLRAATVVAADGANSLVRKRAAQAFARADLSVATGVYAHGMTSDEIVLEMVGNPPGYIWSFPRRDHLAIGICAQATDTGVDALRTHLTAWLDQTGIARGSRLEPYSWPIPALTPEGFDQLRVAGPGWLAVGDAAGLVDPITREGLFFALQSALFAADALLSGRPAADITRHYQERVREEIVEDLRIAATLKAGFFEPAFSHLLVSALASSARIRSVMADLVAGTQPYGTLKRRLIGTCELGLVWRLLREARRLPVLARQ
ncbi:MAG: NAD(P)/FAD-dependent oxidoreductase [Vicinamibacterales bacterium]